jgi:hypothetical protein
MELGKMASILDLPFPHPRKLPTDAEVHQCKTIIAEIGRGIRDIEAEIENLKRRIGKLNRKRSNYNSYIAPFRRLPIEILGEIAILCTTNGDSITKMTSIHSSLRDAIIGMPSLWRYICLTAGSGHGCAFNYCDKVITIHRGLLSL